MNIFAAWEGPHTESSRKEVHQGECSPLGCNHTHDHTPSQVHRAAVPVIPHGGRLDLFPEDGSPEPPKLGEFQTRSAHLTHLHIVTLTVSRHSFRKSPGMTIFLPRFPDFLQST